MSQLVLLGEGHGEVSALPILIAKLLREKNASTSLLLDKDVIRTHSASGLVKWDKNKSEAHFGEWVRRVTYAGRKARSGAVLALYDGDAKIFPAGATSAFCAASAAKALATAAVQAGAGKVFSLAVVFACVEFESWIIAGAESLAGKSLGEGRLALPKNIQFPAGDPESHGKKWLEKNCPSYRPTRDQGALTELLDLNVVRAKNLRSFQRLDRAIDQLIAAVRSGSHISSPS